MYIISCTYTQTIWLTPWGVMHLFKEDLTRPPWLILINTVRTVNILMVKSILSFGLYVVHMYQVCIVFSKYTQKKRCNNCHSSSFWIRDATGNLRNPFPEVPGRFPRPVPRWLQFSTPSPPPILTTIPRVPPKSNYFDNFLHILNLFWKKCVLPTISGCF